VQELRKLFIRIAILWLPLLQDSAFKQNLNQQVKHILLGGELTENVVVHGAADYTSDRSDCILDV